MANVNEKVLASDGVKLSHPMRKVIERHVEKWIERERSLLFLPRDSDYSVYVEKDGERLFSCYIEIRIGSREWSGFAEERCVQEAVLSALRHLRPKGSGRERRQAEISVPA